MSALRLIRPLGRSLRCQPSEQLLVRNQNYAPALCAFISSKANMDGYQRPAPFPYKEKTYNWFYQVVDRTVDRFNENTKVLVVDGPIAAGKSTFAKALAEELDMLYIPEADLDMKFINPYGYDLRRLNSILPLKAQYFDVKDFSRDPKSINSGVMQISMQLVRFEQYIDALAHLYNTGQGVVLDRSIYSDFVFLDAMFDSGYVSKEVKKFYEKAHIGMKLMCKQPHLVIYLDVPVKTVQERIKKRNREWEVNSPALTEKYLSSIEKAYKLKFLKEMSVKSEILVYDWSNFGDVEVVVEDIEKMNFEIVPYEKKFSDWKTDHDRENNYARWQYTREKHDLMRRADPGLFFPELYLDHYESELLEKATTDVAPGGKYEPGYNPDQGDSVLWKLK